MGRGPSFWWLGGQRGRRLLCDSKFAHAVNQGRARQAETSRSAGAAADHPFGFPQHIRDVRAFYFSKRPKRCGRLFRRLELKVGMHQAQHTAGTHYNGALDEILQFPDIAWPRQILQHLHGFVGNNVDRLTETLGEYPNKVSRQQRDVFPSLPQSGQHDGEDIQTILEIRAKRALLNLTPEILIRGGDHAHVNLNRAGTSQPFEPLLLKHPQKLGL